MSDKLERLKLIPNKTLVHIILKIKASDVYSKVAIMMSAQYQDFELFTILEVAQELANRMLIRNDEEVMP